MHFLPEIMKKARAQREAGELDEDVLDVPDETLIELAAGYIAILQVRGAARRQAEAEAEANRVSQESRSEAAATASAIIVDASNHLAEAVRKVAERIVS